MIALGAERVNLHAGIQALAGRSLTPVLCEGGPHLLAQLFAADLVDELCLTMAPLVTCGTELRITAGRLLAVHHQPPQGRESHGGVYRAAIAHRGDRRGSPPSRTGRGTGCFPMSSPCAPSGD